MIVPESLGGWLLEKVMQAMKGRSTVAGAVFVIGSQCGFVEKGQKGLEPTATVAMSVIHRLPDSHKT
jgi:hypothetical protein